ncbi:nuclear transport factor 2 family protein [Rhodococcus wratislaviensis]|uniref:SnoaL-like domain-containing protein n=1 Tax=Rhodococcus wratislaviensis NBRC 100605 TaxID=1219028 RepID=X0Q3B9_RHOWR|nr:nuclear transport factor 2 family protein [Rhodococcus wratislaviensis]GAF45547.1 hypothetical protein RW1_022_01270 [Rhodococcus wratislaviensis NBRC 100605]
MTNPHLDTAAFYAEVRQLAFRYALAVDSRDLVRVASLFSRESDFSRWGEGSEGCMAFFRGVWEKFGPSVHTVTNHVIDRIDDTHAVGTVYCRAEQQQHDKSWRTYQLAYFDRYTIEDGDWHFLSRKSYFWYVDIDGERHVGHPEPRPILPDAWGTWHEFWNTDREHRDQLPSSGSRS